MEKIWDLIEKLQLLKNFVFIWNNVLGTQYKNQEATHCAYFPAPFQLGGALWEGWALSIEWQYHCSSVVPTLCNPMDYSTPGFPVLHCLLEFAQTRVHWVDDDIQPSHSLSSPSPSTSVFHSIRVFCSELALQFRLPKYWSFSFINSISPSNEYSRLISFEPGTFNKVWGLRLFNHF